MVWVILLAGGSGVRLARESVRRFGYAKPKQYSDFGGGTLLDLAIARARRQTQDRRIIVTTTRQHRGEALEILRRYPEVVHIEQPERRDTTSGLLWPLLQVRSWDPAALVVVLPTDHAVTDEDVFAASLREAIELVRANGDEFALLAAEPSGFDEDYGWVVPADHGRWPRVATFREKPPPDELTRLREAGALINTFVFAARAETLEQTFARWVPDCHDALRAALGDERKVEQAFEQLAHSSFSRAVLEHIPAQLRIVPLPRSAGWSDIGTPERLARAPWVTAAAPSQCAIRS